MKYLLLLTFGLALGACGDTTPSETATASEDAMLKTDPLPEAVAQPWGAALTNYLALKESLVSGDVEAAQGFARKMATDLADADMSGMGAMHDSWMASIPALGQQASAFANSADLASAREAFASMTPALVEATGSFGTAEQDLFVMHCPMAFDNEGADWVSAEKEVRNPYFGDAMLTCGKVTDEL